MFFVKLLQRQLPRQPFTTSLAAGLGGAVAIGLVGALSYLSKSPLIMAPFGASCVLLFCAPASPFSQPANVIGGHIVAAFIGLAMRMALPNEWWAVALAVGISIGMMSVLRVTHPPAGANPLVIFADDPGGSCSC
ncbi:HPP family protein [Chelativorans sp. YIM 93263]|uniref:HPP family protein n=1 Tax=Chelativorans sp. YIM 93263 TaxID=2906648 RepID=UPI002379785A|nr:HPP family protein [Chelativorans sp. YIM 93263]